MKDLIILANNLEPKILELYRRVPYSIEKGGKF